jgi:hypothetical protein
MTDPTVAKARQLFVSDKLRGHVVERAALLGAYDKGTYITDLLARAETELLKERPESVEE